MNSIDKRSRIKQAINTFGRSSYGSVCVCAINNCRYSFTGRAK
jgi:hypothetical protein